MNLTRPGNKQIAILRCAQDDSTEAFFRSLGSLRFFPVWARDKEARFGNIRAYGTFLISSEFAHGKVQRVLIVSEKGKPCFVQNPWPGKTVVLYRNGWKAESVNGPQFKFHTPAGEDIALRLE
jgi:hypothetical protein